MALRGTRPDPNNTAKRLKLLLYGEPGVGKTTVATQFPRPYLIDTERGAENEQYQASLKAAGGAYWQCQEPEELIREVTSLLNEKHEYQTLIIDPMTIIHDQLIDSGMRERGEEYGRYKIPVARTMKRLVALVYRLDMNVVMTAHAKAKWVRTRDAKGKEVAAQEGITFDGYDKLEYIFDLVLEMTRRGKDRVARVVKSRLADFPEDEVFPATYEAVAERYGRDVLERNAVPQPTATADQVRELTALFGECGVGEETVEKILKKYGSETLADLPADAAARAIEHYGKEAAGKRRVV